MNIDSGGYSEANSWYFLFMEQMHWQFISYSCSFPSGIHLYKLERCIGCLTISYVCPSHGSHSRNCIPVYTASSSQRAFEEENCNFSQFSQSRKGPWGTWAGSSKSQEVHTSSLKTQANSVVCWTSVALSARVCEISLKRLSSRNWQIQLGCSNASSKHPPCQ